MALLRWLLCCTLTAGLVLPATAANAGGTFTDDDGTPYEEAIEVLVEDEIVMGCGDGEFCPHDAVRRGPVATIISSAFNLPDTRRDHFDDDDEALHEDAINRLAAAGISQGCAEDEYCIGDTLRRGQMASLLARAADLPTTSDSYFRDIGGVHADAINRLAAAGITAGCTSRAARFCPDQHVRRGELAVFVARALDLMPRATLKEQLEAKRKQAAQAERRRQKAERRRQRRAERRRQRAAIPRGVWDRLAACEAGGRWSINTGNGYYGGLQFSLSSWRAVGGSGYPHQASREEQIKRGRLLKARQGWGAWPSCTRKLGLR